MTPEDRAALVRVVASLHRLEKGLRRLSADTPDRTTLAERTRALNAAVHLEQAQMLLAPDVEGWAV